MSQRRRIRRTIYKNAAENEELTDALDMLNGLHDRPTKRLLPKAVCTSTVCKTVFLNSRRIAETHCKSTGHIIVTREDIPDKPEEQRRGSETWVPVVTTGKGNK